MSKVIINVLDGTVVPLDDCYLVDLDTLDDKGEELWQEWEEGGNDGTAGDLGKHSGKNLERILNDCGFGDLRYGNSIAFSVKGLREEIEANIDAGYDVAEGASKLTDSELEELGSYILAGDYLWTVVNGEINSSIREYMNEKKRKKNAKKKRKKNAKNS